MSAPNRCEQCHNTTEKKPDGSVGPVELRPYGSGGKRICYACGKKDAAATERRMGKAIDSAGDVAVLTKAGPKPAPPALRRQLAARLDPSAHLITDGAPSELEAFARSIGMKPAWLQNAGTPREHYDLFGRRLEKALAAGAVQLERAAFVGILRAKKGRT